MPNLKLDKRAHEILVSSKSVVYWELRDNNLILTYSVDGITKAYLVPNQCDGSLQVFTEKNQIFKQLPDAESVEVFIDLPGHTMQFKTRFGTTCVTLIEEGVSEFHINPVEKTTLVSCSDLNRLAKVLSAVGVYGKSIMVNPTVQINKHKTMIACNQFYIEVDIAFDLNATLYAQTLLNLINNIPHTNGLCIGVSSDGIYASNEYNEMSVAQCVRDIAESDNSQFMKHVTADANMINCEILREDFSNLLNIFKWTGSKEVALLFNDTSVGFRVLSPECSATSEVQNCQVFLTNIAMLRLITKVSDSYHFWTEGGYLLCLSTPRLNMKCSGRIFSKT